MTMICCSLHITYCALLLTTDISKASHVFSMALEAAELVEPVMSAPMR